MSNTFTNLLRGNYLRLYVGLDKDTYEKNGKYGYDYSFIEFGIDSATVKKEGKNKKVKEIKEGDICTLVANCGNIKPIKTKVKITVNDALLEKALVSHQSLYEQGYEGPIKVKVIATEDIDLKDLSHLIRIYMYD